MNFSTTGPLTVFEFSSPSPSCSFRQRSNRIAKPSNFDLSSSPSLPPHQRIPVRTFFVAPRPSASPNETPKTAILLRPKYQGFRIRKLNSCPQSHFNSSPAIPQNVAHRASGHRCRLLHCPRTSTRCDRHSDQGQVSPACLAEAPGQEPGQSQRDFGVSARKYLRF